MLDFNSVRVAWMRCVLVPMVGRAKNAGSRVFTAPKTLFRHLSFRRAHFAVARANTPLHPIHPDSVSGQSHNSSLIIMKLATSAVKYGYSTVDGPWELLLLYSCKRPPSAALVLVESFPNAMDSSRSYPFNARLFLHPSFSFYLAIFLATLKQVHSSFCRCHRRRPSYSSVTGLRKIATFSPFSKSPNFPLHQHCTSHERASIPIASLSALKFR
jgi:hypothetical protein